MRPTFGVPMVIGSATVPTFRLVMPVKVPFPSRAPLARVELLIPPALAMFWLRMNPGNWAAVTVPEMLGRVVALAGFRFQLVAMAMSPGDR